MLDDEGEALPHPPLLLLLRLARQFPEKCPEDVEYVAAFGGISPLAHIMSNIMETSE
jgi:hypothetical protein